MAFRIKRLKANYLEHSTMRIINATNKVLANYGLVATEQNIKRAYWRYCKRRGGFNIGLDHQSYILADYLKLNRIAEQLKL